MGSWSPGEYMQQEQPQFVVPLNNNTQVSDNYQVTDQYKACNLMCSTTIKEGLIVLMMTNENTIFLSMKFFFLYRVVHNFFFQFVPYVSFAWLALQDIFLHFFLCRNLFLVIAQPHAPLNVAIKIANSLKKSTIVVKCNASENKQVLPRQFEECCSLVLV